MIESGVFNNKESIKTILIENGYPVKDGNGYISTAAIYRGGDDPTSVAIYDDRAIDFVTSTNYKLEEFIKLITNQSSDVDLQKYLSNKNITFIKPEPKLKVATIFPNEILNKLAPIHNYWINRGIDERVLNELRGGLYAESKGIFKNKYVFPIFNSKNQIIGLTGRATDNSPLRWTHRGQRNIWVWPAFINHKDIINKNSVFLVESPGDLASIFSCGIRNVLCLFGTELNLSILNYLLKINIGKIIISTNDDSMKNNNMAGNRSSEKIYKKLCKYFESKQVKIVLPSGGFNDWNDVLLKAGKDEIKKQLKDYID